VVLGLFWKRATKQGVFTGLIVGLAIVAFLILTGRDPFLGMNAGFVGLIINGFLTVAVSLNTKPRRLDTI
jgi:SSS family solute:Na+ symporter